MENYSMSVTHSENSKNEHMYSESSAAETVDKFIEDQQLISLFQEINNMISDDTNDNLGTDQKLDMLLEEVEALQDKGNDLELILETSSSSNDLKYLRKEYDLFIEELENDRDQIMEMEFEIDYHPNAPWTLTSDFQTYPEKEFLEAKAQAINAKIYLILNQLEDWEELFPALMETINTNTDDTEHLNSELYLRNHIADDTIGDNADYHTFFDYYDNQRLELCSPGNYHLSTETLPPTLSVKSSKYYGSQYKQYDRGKRTCYKYNHHRTYEHYWKDLLQKGLEKNALFPIRMMRMISIQVEEENKSYRLAAALLRTTDSIPEYSCSTSDNFRVTNLQPEII